MSAPWQALGRRNRYSPSPGPSPAAPRRQRCCGCRTGRAWLPPPSLWGTCGQEGDACTVAARPKTCAQSQLRVWPAGSAQHLHAGGERRMERRCTWWPAQAAQEAPPTPLCPHLSSMLKPSHLGVRRNASRSDAMRSFRNHREAATLEWAAAAAATAAAAPPTGASGAPPLELRAGPPPGGGAPPWNCGLKILQQGRAGRPAGRLLRQAKKEQHRLAAAGCTRLPCSHPLARRPAARRGAVLLCWSCCPATRPAPAEQVLCAGHAALQRGAPPPLLLLVQGVLVGRILAARVGQQTGG